MNAFRLSTPAADPTLPFTGALPVENLTERHRPATLAAVVGQGAAVYQLETYLEAPVPQAFLFAGPTGVGKTTMARALAAELGVSPDWGFHQINSAKGDAEAVDDALGMLRLSCPVGSGWKMVVVDEADLMTPKASHLWLSALEDLPSKSVVVFTTNRPEAFPDRFIDRCERIDFAADGATLAQDADALIARVWLAETGRADGAPTVANLPGAIDAKGRISFRRVVAALDPMLRRLGADRKPVAPPMAVPPPAPKPVVMPAIAPVAPLPAPVAPVDAPRASKPTLTMVAGPVTPPTPKQPRPRRAPAKPAPAPTLDSAPTDAARRLAEIDAETIEMGRRLMALDAERKALRSAQKRALGGKRKGA